jgi:signal transduction histidine kinase
VEQLAALVLENGQLVTEVSRQLDEVRRSRRRIVEAGDAERARIERNMHDAVQQRLVAAALTLRRADRNLPQEDAIDLLRQGADQVETALSELRDVVHGLNPQVVSGGLLGALESLSERSSTPVRLTSSLHSAPLPEAVAVTAYYVVAEAMTNAEKHALASLIEIDVSVETNDSGANCLLIRVRDNGLGGARFLPGRGVLGLQDRVEAFGGTLAMSSPTGGGTSLTVSLPLQTPQVDPPGRTRDPAATAAKEHPPVRHPVEIHPSSRPMNDEATAPEQEPS